MYVLNFGLLIITLITTNYTLNLHINRHVFSSIIWIKPMCIITRCQIYKWKLPLSTSHLYISPKGDSLEASIKTHKFLFYISKQEMEILLYIISKTYFLFWILEKSFKTSQTLGIILGGLMMVNYISIWHLASDCDVYIRFW